MIMLPQLSDEMLLEAYQRAIRLGLDRDFIQMLRSELGRRRLPRSETRAN